MSVLRRRFACGASLFVIASATMASAQTAPPPAGSPPPTSPSDAAASVSEVVVTGSLLRRTDKETVSPLTTLTADEVSKAGITTVADAVRSISADNSGTLPTAFGIGFAAGASGVALRGLTVNSTLVLIDGERTASYPLADDGERSFVDLNTIPIAALDRVEVLKDGASSSYGADAIAGVVNVILRPTFTGAQVNAEIGDSQHGGGFSRIASGIFGKGDLDTDRYNVYGTFEYQQDDRIRVSQRDFPYNTSDLSSIGGANNIQGQPTHFSGSTFGSVTPGTITTPGDPTTGLALAGAVSQPLRACGAGSAPSTDEVGNAYCAQNLTALGDDQPSQRRYGFYGRFTAALTPTTRAYVSASYYDNQVTTDTTPSQIQQSVPTNTNSIALPAVLANGQLNPNDPFAAQGQDALLNYAFGDIASKTTTDSHVFRGVADLKGEAFGWSYEGSAVVAHSWLDYTSRGLINYGALINAINTGSYSFIDPASNSAAVRDAISPTLSKTSTSDLDSIDLHASRALFDLPGGPLSFAGGGQFRYEAINDPDLNADLMTQGLGVSQTAGHRTVFSLYGEIDAPIIKPVDFTASARYDHYSDFGDNLSPKFGLKYKPFRQLALRGTYSQGFRAPSFAENGSSSSEGFITYQPPASFQAAHNNDGYVQQYTLAQFTVANAAIKPETSENFTAGFIYEPVRFFSVSLDYYHIRKSGVIAQSSPDTALAAYYAGQPLPAGFTITPDLADPAAPGALARPVVVKSPYVNANSLETSGLDLDIQAHHALPYVDVQWQSELNVTDVFDFLYTQDGVTVNYVGTQAPYILSSGAGTPKYKVNWQNSFTFGKFNITGTLYFTSSFRETAVDAFGPGVCAYTNEAGDSFPSNCKIKAFTDFDLTASYQVTPHLQVYGNILNLFDANAPIDPADYAGVNYNPTYAQQGIIGRYFRVGVRATF